MVLIKKWILIAAALSVIAGCGQAPADTGKQKAPVNAEAENGNAKDEKVEKDSDAQETHSDENVAIGENNTENGENISTDPAAGEETGNQPTVGEAHAEGDLQMPEETADGEEVPAGTMEDMEEEYVAKTKAVLILADGTVVQPEERVLTLKEIQGAKLSVTCATETSACMLVQYSGMSKMTSPDPGSEAAFDTAFYAPDRFTDQEQLQQWEDWWMNVSVSGGTAPVYFYEGNSYYSLEIEELDLAGERTGNFLYYNWEVQ